MNVCLKNIIGLVTITTFFIVTTIDLFIYGDNLQGVPRNMTIARQLERRL